MALILRTALALAPTRLERSEAVELLERLERAAVLPGAKRLNDWNGLIAVMNEAKRR